MIKNVNFNEIEENVWREFLKFGYNKKRIIDALVKIQNYIEFSNNETVKIPVKGNFKKIKDVFSDANGYMLEYEVRGDRMYLRFDTGSCITVSSNPSGVVLFNCGSGLDAWFSVTSYVWLYAVLSVCVVAEYMGYTLVNTVGCKERFLHLYKGSGRTLDEVVSKLMSEGFRDKEIVHVVFEALGSCTWDGE